MSKITEIELIDRVRSVAPGIAGRAAQSEEQRSPHDDSIKELVDTGIFATLTPKRFGGHEFSLDTHVKIIEIISSSCTSTAWVSAFYIGHNLMAAKFSEQLQSEIWAERPFALIPISTAPPIAAKTVSGGWEISGRSSWSTGIMHGEWVGITGAVDARELRVFMMPRADVQMHDVWQMSGMSGTGSNDVEVQEVFVPAHRSVALDDFFSGKTQGSMIHRNPLYQIPLLPFIYNECMCVFSGGLRGATNAYEQGVLARVTSHAQSVIKEKQYTHVLLGQAHANAIAAEALTRDLCNQTLECMRNENWSVSERLRLKTLAAFITQHCRRAVSDMIAHSGTSNFHKDRPLQRFFRDINTLATHAFWDSDATMELYGRDRLGLEPNHPLI